MRPLSYLAPLAWVYGLVATVRARFYQAGYLPSHKLPGTTISVGNLTTGGTGKTPIVLWLAQQFVSEGRRVAILTRGYKGKAPKPRTEPNIVTNVSTPSGPNDALATDSDEVRLLAEHLGDTVAFGIGAKRYLEGMKLAQKGINTFILDDGYQHLELARDVNILLIDATNPFGGGKILPAGHLREPRSAISRADIVAITRSTSSLALEAIVRRHTKAPIVYIDFELQELKPLDAEAAPEISPMDAISPATRWFAFSGIGNAQAFTKSLKDWDLNLAGQKDFPDHHKFTPADIRTIVNTTAFVSATHLVCTEKDRFNLPADVNFGIPAYYCTIAPSSAAQLALWDAIQWVLTAKNQPAA
jgi:tetraacyldisaccharide 4'-kinase